MDVLVKLAGAAHCGAEHAPQDPNTTNAWSVAGVLNVHDRINKVGGAVTGEKGNWKAQGVEA